MWGVKRCPLCGGSAYTHEEYRKLPIVKIYCERQGCPVEITVKPRVSAMLDKTIADRPALYDQLFTEAKTIWNTLRERPEFKAVRDATNATTRPGAYKFRYVSSLIINKNNASANCY